MGGYLCYGWGIGTTMLLACAMILETCARIEGERYMSLVQSDVSFTLGTVGLVLPFVVTDKATGLPISNALSATVTWVAQNGVRRPLTLEVPASAVYVYTVSAGDFRTPRREVGRLFVDYGVTEFWTSNFTVAVHPVF